MAVIVKRYPANLLGRTFVVGDLHGCIDQLFWLLALIGFNFDVDILYCTGDLGDRGPSSKRCFALLDLPWFRSVKGNHELLILQAAVDLGFDWGNWINQGGSWAKELTKEELFELAQRVFDLPDVIVVGEGVDRFNIFHAEFHGSDEKLDALDGKRWPPVYLQQGRDLIEGRIDEFYHEGLSQSFVGHTIVKEPTRIGSHVYIDTGGYMALNRSADSPYGLTIVEPSTNQAWQFKN